MAQSVVPGKGTVQLHLTVLRFCLSCLVGWLAVLFYLCSIIPFNALLSQVLGLQGSDRFWR